MSDQQTRYVLRTVGPDRKSRRGFVWPESGPVEAPDWNPEPVCGGGLHGLLDGQGNATLLDERESALWQIVAVDEDDIVDLGDKIKFRRGTVLYTGARDGALAVLRRKGVTRPLPFERIAVESDKEAVTGYRGHIDAGPYTFTCAFAKGTIDAGSGSVALAGYEGRVTAGHSSIAVTGHSGASTAKTGSVAVAGCNGRATVDYESFALALALGSAYGKDSSVCVTGIRGTSVSGMLGTSLTGNFGTAESGYEGRSISGKEGTSVSGEYGEAFAGTLGTAKTGAHGRASAGYNGTAAAGPNGEIHIVWRDKQAGRFRTAVGYVGENGLEPNVLYRVNGDGEFVRAD